MFDDELRTRLRDLNDVAASAVIPPGVEKARRTLRRRRVVRTALVSIVVIACGVIGLASPDKTVPPPNTSTTEPPTTPSPFSSGTATPTPATSVTPSRSARAGGSPMGLEPYLLEYGDNLSTAVSKDGTVNIPIGVVTWGNGTATGVRLTADFSQLTSKVDIVGVGSPCSRSGSTVSCDFGTLHINGQKRFSATLSLRGKPDAPVGEAGRVYLHLTADPMPGVPDRSGRVAVYPNVADLVMTSTVPTARVGQTVTVAFTAKNQGPSPEPWVTLAASGVQPGTEYVGGEGCTFTATTFDCRIEDLPAGQTRVVKVTVRVNSCPPRGDTTSAGLGWSAAYQDPDVWNNNLQLQIRLQGC
jgi:hypothetical protein